MKFDGHRQYGFYDSLGEPGHAHDSRLGIFLRRTRGQEERARDHDAELCLDGRDHGALGARWLLHVF